MDIWLLAQSYCCLIGIRSCRNLSPGPLFFCLWSENKNTGELFLRSAKLWLSSPTVLFIPFFAPAQRRQRRQKPLRTRSSISVSWCKSWVLEELLNTVQIWEPDQQGQQCLVGGNTYFPSKSWAGSNWYFYLQSSSLVPLTPPPLPHSALIFLIISLTWAPKCLHQSQGSSSEGVKWSLPKALLSKIKANDKLLKCWRDNHSC